MSMASRIVVDTILEDAAYIESCAARGLDAPTIARSLRRIATELAVKNETAPDLPIL